MTTTRIISGNRFTARRWIRGCTRRVYLSVQFPQGDLYFTESWPLGYISLDSDIESLDIAGFTREVQVEIYDLIREEAARKD